MPDVATPDVEVASGSARVIRVAVIRDDAPHLALGHLARVPSSSTERSVIAGDTGELRAAHEARRLPGDAD
jgi:hypothetical protein